jgi:hydrogenase-4 component B
MGLSSRKGRVIRMINRIVFPGIGGLGISFMYTGFRGIWGLLTVFAWIVTFLYSIEFMKNDKKFVRYFCFNIATLLATLGIFFAGDLFTVFFFFEIMSFTSFMWVAHRQTDKAYYAAGTYLGIAIAGGLAILMGIFIVYSKLGTLSFGAFGKNSINVAAFEYINNGGDMTWLYAAAICMFVGFGAKAGAFPVHAWLPDSYTEAPTPATALLSSILSKTGVFGILLVTIEVMPAQSDWAMFVLVIGVITMVLGGIKGVMSGNLKTTLAYSSMSQIGFILVGVGMQGLLNEVLYLAEQGDTVAEAYEMAVNGTLLHMVNHSLVKLVLFLAAGIVFMNVGSYELNKVKGFGRKKPFLWVVFILAGAGVAGIPMLNGYVSKTLIHESIVEYQNIVSGYGASDLAVFMKAVEYLFLFSGGLTVAYITKLFVVLFIEKNDDEKVQAEFDGKKEYASSVTKIAVALCALPIPFIGVLPNIVARKIAGYGFVDSYINYMYEFENASVNYFSLKNLSGAVISIVVGAVVYVLVVRLWMLHKKEVGYREIYPKWLDMEKYIYRAVFYTAVPFALGIISRILDSVVDIVVVFLRHTVYCDRELPYELPEGNHLGHDIGRSMERIYKLYCGIVKKEYKPKNYEHKIAIIGEDLFENMMIIERSLSFGLFMFCVGLGLTLMYLLMVN